MSHRILLHREESESRHSGPPKEFYVIAAHAVRAHFSPMDSDPQRRPPDCTCDGEGLQLVSSVPRVGAMPELYTYRCEACGHVETHAANQAKPKPPSVAS